AEPCDARTLHSVVDRKSFRLGEERTDRLISKHQIWSPTMPRSRSHQPNSEFTTTSMKLRGEIRDILLPKITHLDMLKHAAEDLVSSRTFHLHVGQLDATTFNVDVRYRSIHMGTRAPRVAL